jgi:hypothetical protein
MPSTAATGFALQVRVRPCCPPRRPTAGRRPAEERGHLRMAALRKIELRGRMTRFGRSKTTTRERATKRARPYDRRRATSADIPIHEQARSRIQLERAAGAPVRACSIASMPGSRISAITSGVSTCRPSSCMAGSPTVEIKGVQFIELKAGPHGVLWTQADRVSGELVSFLG